MQSEWHIEAGSLECMCKDEVNGTWQSWDIIYESKKKGSSR